MDQLTMIALVAVAIVVAFIVILFRRSGTGSITLPGLKANVEADKPGATIRGNEVEGRRNEMTASGDGALIEGNKAKGDENKFTAS